MDNLLFVEDEEGQQELTERLYQMCRKSFHGEVEFITSSTWREGLGIIRARPISVLLLDLILLKDVPPLGRDDTLEIIRTTPDLPPIVVLSGITDDTFLPDKCILAGADDFMWKQDVNHHPETLCRAAYYAYMRRQRELRNAQGS